MKLASALSGYASVCLRASSTSSVGTRSSVLVVRVSSSPGRQRVLVALLSGVAVVEAVSDFVPAGSAPAAAAVDSSAGADEPVLAAADGAVAAVLAAEVAAVDLAELSVEGADSTVGCAVTALVELAVGLEIVAEGFAEGSALAAASPSQGENAPANARATSKREFTVAI